MPDLRCIEALKARVDIMALWANPDAMSVAEDYWGNPERSVAAVIESSSRADCYWVNDDLTDLVLHASKLFPPEPLVSSDFPSSDGVVLFAKPFMATDYGDTADRDYGEVAPLLHLPVSVITWGPGTRDNGRPFLQLMTYHQVKGTWLPYIHDQWDAGDTYEDGGQDARDRLGDRELPGGLILFKREAQHVRRVLQTFWRVSQQQIAVHQTEHHRRVGRFQQRQPVPPTTLRVVRLRSVSNTSQVGDAQNVDWSHRWIVSGHWRNQWLPSVKMHRQQWIAPHVKGPEDKPLVLKETVKALVR